MYSAISHGLCMQFSYTVQCFLSCDTHVPTRNEIRVARSETPRLSLSLSRERETSCARLARSETRVSRSETHTRLPINETRLVRSETGDFFLSGTIVGCFIHSVISFVFAI